MSKNIKLRVITPLVAEEKTVGLKRSSQRDEDDANKRPTFDADKMFGSNSDLVNLNDPKEVDAKEISKAISSLSLSDINITLTTPNSSPAKDDSNSRDYLQLASLQSQLDR